MGGSRAVTIDTDPSGAMGTLTRDEVLDRLRGARARSGPSRGSRRQVARRGDCDRQVEAAVGGKGAAPAAIGHRRAWVKIAGRG
jgi:hypothetical protein